MASGEVTPWTWINATLTCMATLPWWTDGDVDRTPHSITPGTPEASLDKCRCEGQITVTAGEVFYVGDNSFPNRAQIPPKIRKEADNWAVTITVEYGRCRPGPDERGPTPDADLLEAAPLLHLDSWAIWEGLRCCIDEWNKSIASAVIVTGPVPIVGRQITKCAAWSYQFTAMVRSCGECDE